jgi:hypothetical protein
MPTSFDSTRQKKLACDWLLPRAATVTALVVTNATVGGNLLQSRIDFYEQSNRQDPPSSTVAATGSSGINTTSINGAQPSSFLATQTVLTRPATLSGANVNVPSSASAANQANGASAMVPAIPSASYPPSSTVAAAGSSGINTTSINGTQPSSFQATQTMLTRPATLSGANVNVPSSASAANQANGASDMAPPGKPTGGLSLTDEAHSSLPTRRVTRSSTANAPRRFTRSQLSGSV